MEQEFSNSSTTSVSLQRTDGSLITSTLALPSRLVVFFPVNSEKEQGQSVGLRIAAIEIRKIIFTGENLKCSEATEP